MELPIFHQNTKDFELANELSKLPRKIAEHVEVLLAQAREEAEDRGWYKGAAAIARLDLDVFNLETNKETLTSTDPAWQIQFIKDSIKSRCERLEKGESLASAKGDK